uniref:Uncharacterized protein n=1 Tax=Panstrongylus lignarius TaxID=156445 RepID=A0A224XSR6_9HEMI
MARSFLYLTLVLNRLINSPYTGTAFICCPLKRNLFIRRSAALRNNSSGTCGALMTAVYASIALSSTALLLLASACRSSARATPYNALGDLGCLVRTRVNLSIALCTRSKLNSSSAISSSSLMAQSSAFVISAFG